MGYWDSEQNVADSCSLAGRLRLHRHRICPDPRSLADALDLPSVRGAR